MENSGGGMNQAPAAPHSPSGGRSALRIAVGRPYGSVANANSIPASSNMVWLVSTEKLTPRGENSFGPAASSARMTVASVTAPVISVDPHDNGQENRGKRRKSCRYRAGLPSL
jgi:hypothetical protein